MSETEIQNKTITIEKVETSKLPNGSAKISVTDQDNKRYSFFPKTKAGVDSKPYVQFRTMALETGSTVRIGFVSESFTGQDGSPRKSNKIISFTEPFDKDVANIEQPSEALADEPAPKKAGGHPETRDPDKWEAVDRLHAAQTAANFVATIHEGTEKGALALKPEMDEVYAWLLAKKNGGQGGAGEEIGLDDIPF